MNNLTWQRMNNLLRFIVPISFVDINSEKMMNDYELDNLTFILDRLSSIKTNGRYGTVFTALLRRIQPPRRRRSL